MATLDLGNLDSWKSYIQQVEKEKKSLPWDPSKVDPVKHVDAHERRLRDRKLNPIRMEYIDPSQESAYQHIKEDLNRTRIERVDEMRATKYDIVGHFGPPREFESKRWPDKSLIKRDYHILSNLSIADHGYCTLLPDEQHLRKARAKPVHFLSKSKQREFNLITNQFRDNHSEKIAQEYKHMKEHVLEKYWQTHNFDLVKGEFFDQRKEDYYQSERDYLAKTHGQFEKEKLPKSLKNAEGQYYNVLNNTLNSNVSNDESTFMFSLDATRAQNRVNKGLKVEREYKGQLDSAAEKYSEKKINRISYKNWEVQIKRGYDIVTTSDSRGFKPVPKPSISSWDRLVSTGDASMNSTMSSSINTDTHLPSVQTLMNLKTKYNTEMKDAKAIVPSRPKTSMIANIPNLDLARARVPSAPAATNASPS